MAVISHHGSGQNNIDFRRMFSGDCFDFDSLSVSSLGGLMLKREQKEAVSHSREGFPSCGSISTPRCIFKRVARRISSTPAHSEILNRFPVKMYLFFPP